MDIDEATELWKAGRMSNADYDRIIDAEIEKMKRRHPVSSGASVSQGNDMQKRQARLLLQEGRLTVDVMEATSRAGILTIKTKDLMDQSVKRNALRAELLLKGEDDSTIIASLARREKREVR